MIPELVITFVFVFALLMLNFPQLQYDEVIKQKIYLFTSIFIFYCVGSICILLYQRQIIDIKKILKNSLQTGLLAVVGYSIYRDCEEVSESSVLTNLKASVIIIAFVAVGYIFDSLVTNKNSEMNDCLNLLYKQKS